MSAVILVWSPDCNVCTLSLACFGFCFPEVFVFQGYFDLSGVWLIFTFSRPPAPLETITFLLFPAMPSTVCAQSWHLMLCRYSLVWYDCAETLCFSKTVSVRVFCCRRSDSQGDREHPPRALPLSQQSNVPPIPVPLHFQTWRRDTRIMVYFPGSKAVQILFLFQWSLSVLVTGTEI